VKNKTIQKHLLIILGLFLFSGAEVFSQEKVKKEYWAIRNVKLSSLGPKQRAQHHQRMTRILIKLGAMEKKPSFFGGSRFSYQKILNDLAASLIPQCHASSTAEFCLFGGWPSVRSGRCNTPYSSTGKAAAAQLGTTQYDSNHFCNSKNLFRCNPLVFGPGMDQTQAGDDFSNINGFSNNSSPFSAGICVDISGGFNGLSQKCQDVSDHLDQVREAKGMAPWRETDFFNEQRANEFNALQEVIADRCEANRDVINADGMCDSLERSLSLTAIAANAGKINGINSEEIVPTCIQEGVAADGDASCARKEDASLANLYKALDKLKAQQACKFGRVQAVDSATGSIEVFEPSACELSVEGQLSSGLSEETKITINLKGQDGAFAGSIKAQVSPSMSEEEILSQFNVEGSEFKEACHRAAAVSCNQPKEDSKGFAVAQALSYVGRSSFPEEYKDKKGRTKTRQISCGFNSIDVKINHGPDNGVENLEGSQASTASKHCQVQFSGELKDKLESENFRNENIKVSVEVFKGGRVLKIPMSLDSASLSNLSQKIKKTEGFSELCRGEVGLTAMDLAQAETEAAEVVKSMREAFGFNEGQYLTSAQQEALTKLQGVEGLDVKVDEFGGMTFSHNDINSVADQLESSFPGIYINRESGKSARLFPSSEVRIEFLAERSSTDFTQQEQQMLVQLESRKRDDSIDFISGVTRNFEGNVVFLTNGMEPLSPERMKALESSLGGQVIDPDQESSDPSIIRSYVIRAPAAADAGTSNLGEVFSRDLSLANERGLEQVRENSAVKREIDSGEGRFDVNVGAAISTEGGGVTIPYSLDISGRSSSRISNINLYLSNIKREAAKNNCEVRPTTAASVKEQGAFNIVCPPQN